MKEADADIRAFKDEWETTSMTRALISVPVDDFITPAADDAAMRIAQLLAAHGIRGCFHVVGENARVMLRRGRRDVIKALKQHEIGFHSNLHSIYPMPIETMDSASWEEGVRAFVECELPGVRDVAETFGRWPAYYTHNMAVAPQTIYGAHLLGMDAVGTPTVGPWPVMRYAGNLLVRWDVGFDPPKLPDDEVKLEGRVDRAMEKFGEIAESRDPGFPIRVFTHCNKYPTYANADSANFTGARTPPREQWKLPPLRGKEVVERLFAQFNELLDRLVAVPDIEFVTYSDMIREFRPKPRWLSAGDVRQLAAEVGPEFDPVDMDGEALTCAEMFGVLCRFIAQGGEEIAVRRIIGPLEDPLTTQTAAKVASPAFAEICRRIDQQIDDSHAVPGSIDHESIRFGPGSWLRAMAAFVLQAEAEEIGVEPGSEYPAVVADEFFKERDIRWGYYSKQFTGEKILRDIRAQSWSAAPAG